MSETQPSGPFGATAGIVIYHPDLAALERLIASVADEVATVMVFANSAISAEEAARLQRSAQAAEFLLLQPGGNLGLGAAYDAFVEAARSRDAEFLLLLDQDSQPTRHMISRLVARHRALAIAGERPILVGPQPVDDSGQPMKIPVLGPTRAVPASSDLVAVQFAISSGSLLRLEDAVSVGPFRADFFIDAIDVEWCMRASFLGYSVWIARDVLMPHCLGRGLIRLPAGLCLTDQPARRLYTYLRNQLAMLRLPHVPFGHKLKFLVSLPIRIAVYLQHGGFSGDSRRALANGLIDGVTNRLGPPDGAFRRPFSRGDRSRAPL